MDAQTKSARWVGWLFVIAVLALGLGSAIAGVEANGTTTVFVQPDHQQVLVGSSGSVDLQIENVYNLFAVQLSMSYDPSVIQITDADSVAPGVQIGAGDVFDGRAWHADLNKVDPVAGSIVYIFTLDDSSDGGVTGDHVLAHIDFATLQPGSSPVMIVDLVLADPTGTSIEYESTDGLVRVVHILASATPSPTRSPTATALPCQDPCTTPCCCPCRPGPLPSVEPSPTECYLPTVYIDPDSQWFFPSHEGWVDIRISNVLDLYAAWVKLSYNPAVVEILDSDLAQLGVQIEHGDLWGTKFWYPVANVVNPGEATITYGAKLSYTEQTSSGGGQLARIHFRTLQPGVSPFDFFEVILADRDAVSIETENLRGVVEVGVLRPTHTPTATPTPRYSPTPTPACPCVTPTPPCGCATPTSVPSATPTREAGLEPLLYVYPDGRSMVVGEEALIEIRIQDVSGLYGAEFHLNFDPSLITIQDENTTKAGTQIAFGAFITPGTVAQNNVDTTAGRVDFAISQAPPAGPSSGDGIIAKMRVVAMAEGATPLSLFDTILADADNNPIPHNTAGGFVAINSRTVVGVVRAQGRIEHQGIQIVQSDGLLSAMDVLAITGADGQFVFASPVGAGEKLEFMAMLEGYLPRLAEITVPTDPVVDMGMVILLGGDAVGSQLAVDRTLGCPGDLTVQIPGEPDWAVNILDLTFVGSYFGADPSWEGWMPSPDGCHPEWIGYRGDLNDDLAVNIFDLVQVGNNFGESGPVPW